MRKMNHNAALIPKRKGESEKKNCNKVSSSFLCSLVSLYNICV